MILLIQLHQKTLLLGLLKENNKFIDKQEVSWRISSEKTFPSSVDKFLKRNHLSIKDINRIAIETNQGSYTTTRIVLLFINTWLWAEKVIVYFNQKTPNPTLTEMAKNYLSFRKVKPPLFPIY